MNTFALWVFSPALQGKPIPPGKIGAETELMKEQI